MITRAESSVLRVAARQLGVVTRGQALAAGMSGRAINRRSAGGAWEPLHPGVYRVSGTPSSWHQMVLAACFAAGPHAAASHVTSAVLWGLIDRVDPPVEITVPFGKHPRVRSVTVHRSRVAFELRRLNGIPVTSAARTLFDLTGVLTVDELEEALDIALRRKLVAAEKLYDRTLEPASRGRRGTGKLNRLLSQRLSTTAVSESVLETRFLRALREHSVPLPEPQYEIRSGGRIVARADFAYPRERIAIELDGYRDHSSRRAFDRDRARQNVLVRAGWTPLRFTWNDLARPRHACEVVRGLLGERGHPDVVSL